MAELESTLAAEVLDCREFPVLVGSALTGVGVDRLVNSRTSTEERLHGLFALRGKEQTSVAAVTAGDIAAVAKLATTRTGDTLAPKGSPESTRSSLSCRAAS